MSKSPIKLNPAENTIIVSKTFYNKATVYGSDEYRVLHRVMKENPTFHISFKTTDKKTYNGLTFERMEEYILTQENSVERFIEYKAVRATAKAKGAQYPLTKKWFFATYPEYKKNTIIPSEKALNDVREALKKAEEEKAKKETAPISIEEFIKQNPQALIKDPDEDLGDSIIA